MSDLELASTRLDLEDEEELRWYLAYAAGDLSALRSGLGPQIERMRAAGGRNRGSKPVPAWGGDGGGQGVELTEHLAKKIRAARRVETILAEIGPTHGRTLAALHGPGLSPRAEVAWGWLAEGTGLTIALLLVTAERLHLSRGEMQGWHIGARDYATCKDGAYKGKKRKRKRRQGTECLTRALGPDLCPAAGKATAAPSPPSATPAGPPACAHLPEAATAPAGPLAGPTPQDDEMAPPPPGDCPPSPVPEARRPLSPTGRLDALDRLRQEAEVADIQACRAYNRVSERLGRPREEDEEDMDPAVALMRLLTEAGQTSGATT